jgi:hypothetical protein
MSGMNTAAYQMLGAVTGMSGGNLDDLVSEAASFDLAKVQFEASAKVAQVQSNTIGAVIDMLV